MRTTFSLISGVLYRHSAGQGHGRVPLVAVVATSLACLAWLPAGTATARLNPGSPRHPQGLKLMMAFGWTGLAAPQRPTLTRLDVWFPRGSVYNGSKYPRCSKSVLDARGPAGCPKGSIMGHGDGTANADTTITHPTITVVNGGAKTVYFYTVLNNPARVQEPVVGHITKLAGRYTYHLSATIPKNLRIVAGVPIKLTRLTVWAGRGTWLAITSVPAGIKIASTYDNGETISSLVWVEDS
jgi:hypothetical protein